MISLLAVIVLLGACKQKPDNISSGTIKDSVKELLKKNGQDLGVIEIPVGYYELNNIDVRYQLARLAEAGLIDLKVERYDWWTKVLRIHNTYGDPFGSINYYEEKHIMVDVQLTDAGKKLIVENDSIEPDIDKDMKQPEINFEDYPENKLTMEDYPEKYENWPPIPNPENVAESVLQKDNTVLKKDTTAVKEALNYAAEQMKDAFADNNENLKKIDKVRHDANYEVLEMDYETANGYREAKQKEKKETVTIRAFKLKVEKARFIQIFNTDHGTYAQAEIIVQYKDVTPACRAWYQIYDNERLCAPVNFIYFYDKGWVLLDKYLNFSKNSTLADSFTVQREDPVKAATPVSGIQGDGGSMNSGMYDMDGTTEMYGHDLSVEIDD